MKSTFLIYALLFTTLLIIFQYVNSKQIIEKYENILMIPFSEKWSDVGTMNSLMQHYPKDENQNVAIGNSTIIDSKNTFLNALGCTCSHEYCTNFSSHILNQLAI